MHVLIVEDAPEVVEIVEVALKIRWPESQVTSVARGGMAPNIIASSRPDLIILDLGLPDMDGLELLTQIRQVSELPIIILTARRHEAATVRGLEMGADDYVTKPFSPTELLARVRAVMRRATRSQATRTSGQIVRESLSVDLQQNSATVNGKLVPLSRLEWEVFAYLAQNAGRVVSHDELKRRGWGSSLVEDSVVKMCIRRVRNKLQRSGGNGEVIITHRGTGYSFVG